MKYWLTACNWHQPFLNQWKEENDRRNRISWSISKKVWDRAGIKTVSSPHGQAWQSSWPVLCAHTFACNLQQPFLNQWKEEYDRRNYIMINLQEIIGPGQDRDSQFT